MARARRIDYSTLKAPTRRADGTLVAEALLTRTGVFSYRNPDGSERREYRPPQQVFDAKSLESFKLVPLTDDHPPVMVNAQNARQYSVGAVGENVRKDGKFIAATIAVHDAATIAKMDAGKTAVSCGYECDLDETPGTSPDGERYDAIQTNIVGNHLAIVTNARAGSAAAVRMDAAAMCGPDDRDDNEINAEARDKLAPKEFAASGGKLPIENADHVRAAMSRFGQTEFKDAGEKKSAFGKIVAKAKALGVDSSGFEKSWQGRLDHGASSHRKDSKPMTPEEIAELEKKAAKRKEQRDAAIARADAAEKERDALKTQVSELTAKRDSLTTELAAAEKARKDALDGGPVQVKARVALLTNAGAVLGPKLVRADKSEVALIDVPDRDLRLAVIKHVENVDCDVDADGKKRDDVYVGARYDAAIERAAKSQQAFAGAGNFILQNRMDANGGDGAQNAAANELAKARAEKDKARQDMIDRNQGWSEPTAGNGEKGK